MFDRLKKIFSKNNPPKVLIGFGKRILAIDDDPSLRIMVKRTLERQGYGVISAEDGLKGLAMAESEHPDLILLDVMMPGMQGHEVCRRLKANPSTKKIPVIFLTSVETPKSVIEAYDIGAEIHLTKPIRAKELISQIEMTFKENPSS